MDPDSDLLAPILCNLFCEWLGYVTVNMVCVVFPQKTVNEGVDVVLIISNEHEY